MLLNDYLSPTFYTCIGFITVENQSFYLKSIQELYMA